jgi:hypothetical protein
MKSATKKLLVPAVIIIVMAFSMNESVLGQSSPPLADAVSSNHNGNGNKEANAAPIGDGIWVLITLAVSYGLSSYLRKNERKTDTEPEMIEIVANENFDQDSLKNVKEKKIYNIENEA